MKRAWLIWTAVLVAVAFFAGLMASGELVKAVDRHPDIEMSIEYITHSRDSHQYYLDRPYLLAKRSVALNFPFEKAWEFHTNCVIKYQFVIDTLEDLR